MGIGSMGVSVANTPVAIVWIVFLVYWVGAMLYEKVGKKGEAVAEKESKASPRARVRTRDASESKADPN